MPQVSTERARQRGRVIAELMSAAVLGRVPGAVDADDLRDIVSLLSRFGTGPLGWWAVRGSALADTEPGQALRDTYRAAALRASLADAELGRLFQDIAAAGLDPVLGKGWAAARAYPAAGLRTYGDFDLYCLGRGHDRLMEVLASRIPAPAFAVDTHAGLSYLDDRDPDEVFERTVRIPHGDATVRVFGAEDQLRLACLHAFAEGLTRPAWLCDIALMAAHAPKGFDWAYFADGSRRRVDWCVAALRLSHELLGASLAALPAGLRRDALPRWLIQSVTEAWGRGPHPRGARAPMQHVARSPRVILRALIARWPQPIEATVGVGGRINGWPRLPYEIAEAARRTVGYLRRLR